MFLQHSCTKNMVYWSVCYLISVCGGRKEAQHLIQLQSVFMIKQGNASYLWSNYNFQLNPNRHNSSQEGIGWIESNTENLC